MLNMDEQEFSQLIETSFEAILSGSASLEDILKQHPGEAELLRPELESALWLVRKQDYVRARPGFVAASRKRIVARIQQESASRGAKRGFLGFLWPRPVALRGVAVALLGLAIVLGGTGGLVTASRVALPGENLYPVKRSVEQFAFDLTFAPEQRVSLSAEFSQRRLEEAETLIIQGSLDTAEETLSEFEREVERSAVLLNQVSEENAVEKRKLAIALREGLAQQSDRIADLAEFAPDSVEDDLSQAMAASSESAEMALTVVQDIDEKMATPTVMPSETYTATIAPSATALPTETPQPVVTETADAGLKGGTAEHTPAVDSTNGAQDKVKKPTNTPKPPNENKPANTSKPPNENKPENPPANDNSNSSQGQDKDDKEDKPDNPGGGKK